LLPGRRDKPALCSAVRCAPVTGGTAGTACNAPQLAIAATARWPSPAGWPTPEVLVVLAAPAGPPDPAGKLTSSTRPRQPSGDQQVGATSTPSASARTLAGSASAPRAPSAARATHRHWSAVRKYNPGGHARSSNRPPFINPSSRPRPIQPPSAPGSADTSWASVSGATSRLSPRRSPGALPAFSPGLEAGHHPRMPLPAAVHATPARCVARPRRRPRLVLGGARPPLRSPLVLGCCSQHAVLPTGWTRPARSGSARGDRVANVVEVGVPPRITIRGRHPRSCRRPALAVPRQLQRAGTRTTVGEV